jgi:uncharacterized protein (TIGR03437 family)
LLFLSALFLTTQITQAQSILGSNLIVNPGAESGPAGTASVAAASFPGWTVTGKTNVLAYGITGQVLLTDPTPAPPPYGPGPGFQYFGCVSGTCSFAQTISVASAASTISGGNVKFTASAYFGARAGAAVAQMTLAFQNSAGQQFSMATVGPGGLGASGMSLQSQIGLVPTGTTQILVTLTMTNQFQAADGLSLVLTTLGTTPGAVLGTNLIVNGNAEAGPGVPHTATALYVPGWSTADGASVVPYGGTGWIQPTDAGPADRGVNLFCGTGSSYQDIDVSAAATLIDGGQVTYEMSAWLGGTAGTSPTLTYTFFNWAGTQVGTTAQLGPLNRPSVGVFEASHSGMLPAGTRRVHIALSFQGSFSAADDIAFTLAAPTGPPVITPGNIISAGAFGAFSTIAAGTWIEIYGTNLTSSTPLQWSGAQFINGVGPTQVGDVTVSIGGTAAYIDYISPSQVNALVPSNAPTGSVEITLTNAQGTTDGFPIYINPTEPGLLAPASFIVNNKQYLAALFSDGQTFVLPTNAISGVASRPANVGETITIYGIGFGPVTGGFTAGTIVTAQNSLTTPIQITFGSTQATLAYYGLAPGFTGLYQFNVVVPNVAANSALPISFSLGGVKGTQTLYIAVAN